MFWLALIEAGMLYCVVKYRICSVEHGAELEKTTTSFYHSLIRIQIEPCRIKPLMRVMRLKILLFQSQKPQTTTNKLKWIHLNENFIGTCFSPQTRGITVHFIQYDQFHWFHTISWPCINGPSILASRIYYMAVFGFK